ncbi:MAG: acyl-ACP thioesterase domain-containing protein [bacterium]
MVAESHTQDFRVRFDECGPDAATRASSVLRYVIETAFGHSAREGYPLSWYEDHGLFWLVRRARLELTLPLLYGTTVAVTTRVVGFQRIWARRENEIRHAGGIRSGEVTMDWIFTDREGHPARILREIEERFPGLLRSPDVVHLDLPDPPLEARTDEYRVPAHQVDPRGHVNSAAYLDLFDDALADAGVDLAERPAVYELEYLRAAAPGDALRRTVWRDDGRWAMTVTSAAGLVARARREAGERR